MSAETTIEEYYDALRAGEPLAAFFAADALVKFGIGERLEGSDGITEGLREQTRTTENWTVESHDLRVTEEGEWAWFADDVRMAWDDIESDGRHDHRTRWSGGLRRGDDGWRFVGMHVSVPEDS
jgi:ketosteroid isomerase-like protein